MSLLDGRLFNDRHSYADFAPGQARSKNFCRETSRSGNVYCIGATIMGTARTRPSQLFTWGPSNTFNWQSVICCARLPVIRHSWSSSNFESWLHRWCTAQNFTHLHFYLSTIVGEGTFYSCPSSAGLVARSCFYSSDDLYRAAIRRRRRALSICVRHQR
jgi:hypothetical protein